MAKAYFIVVFTCRNGRLGTLGAAPAERKGDIIEDFFAVIGFLTVVGAALWFWRTLEGDVRHPASGMKRTPAQQRDWERVKEARRKEGNL